MTSIQTNTERHLGTMKNAYPRMLHAGTARMIFTMLDHPRGISIDGLARKTQLARTACGVMRRLLVDQGLAWEELSDNPAGRSKLTTYPTEQLVEAGAGINEIKAGLIQQALPYERTPGELAISSLHLYAVGHGYDTGLTLSQLNQRIKQNGQHHPQTALHLGLGAYAILHGIDTEVNRAFGNFINTAALSAAQPA